MSRLREKYNKQIIPEMKKEFGLKNDMEVPKVVKVVLNTGIGRVAKDAALVEAIQNDMTTIAGQKATKTKAKKSIAAFKVRTGMNIGIKVTLRGNRMYDFIDRLVSLSIPRTRDFRGIDLKSIDNDGNLTVGIKEHIVFPEINQENTKGIFGFEVTVVTNKKDRKQAEKLFRLLGFPLKKESN